MAEDIYLTLSVSIHAPMRGATESRTNHKATTISFNPRAHAGRDIEAALEDCARFMFQSTRPCGARPAKVEMTVSITICFNPRAHAGRDLLKPLFYLPLAVSIHAPMRGATSIIY